MENETGGEGGQDKPEGGQRPDKTHVTMRHEKQKAAEESRFECDPGQQVSIGQGALDKPEQFIESEFLKFSLLLESLAEEDNPHRFEEQAEHENRNKADHIINPDTG